MAKIKIRRKDLKHDEVKDFTLQAWEWCQEHSTFVIIIILAVAAAIGGKQLYRNMKQSKIEAINNEYYAAYSEYLKAVNEMDADQRAQYAAEAEAQLRSVAKKYPNSVLGRQALKTLANQYYFLDDIAQARETFQQLLNTAQNSEQKAEALIALGDCCDSEAFAAKDNAQKQAKLQEALEYYSKANEAAPKSYLGAFALLKKAGILKLDPQTREQAIQLCEQIKSERPADNASMLAKLNTGKFNAVELDDVSVLEKTAREQTLYGIAEAELKSIKQMQ
ncbi:hypothetical protein JXA32_13675 [Candidatus Sumerlaeota bacterium]|nr:hypothetical protein [Candidatus Sumerlaeota bacterium]